MRALLDVNVLIALLDAAHVHHQRAMEWLGNNVEQGWASCPLTQNGCLRIMTQSAYPNSSSIIDLAQRLEEATQTPFHEFWADDLSLLDQALFERQELLLSRQLTDTYLLALAVKHNAVFITFDRTVPLKAVRSARPGNLLIL